MKLKEQASAEGSSSDEFEELRKWTEIAERIGKLGSSSTTV